MDDDLFLVNADVFGRDGGAADTPGPLPWPERYCTVRRHASANFDAPSTPRTTKEPELYARGSPPPRPEHEGECARSARGGAYCVACAAVHRVVRNCYRDTFPFSHTRARKLTIRKHETETPPIRIANRARSGVDSGLNVNRQRVGFSTTAPVELLAAERLALPCT